MWLKMIEYLDKRGKFGGLNHNHMKNCFQGFEMI